jgi:site-specific recombinase XerD
MKVDPDGPLGAEEASFIAQMRRQVKSENTVEAYIWGLKHLRGYMRDNGIAGFVGINREVLEEWQDHLATNISPLKKRPLSPRSQGLCASAARMFFTWAAIRDKCDAKLPMLFTKVKVAPLQPRPLTHDVMLRIRHYFIEKTGTPRYMMVRALFFYTIGVGARVSEVLRVPRIGWERVTVVQKGGSLKTLICPDVAANMVRAYLAMRIDDCPSLWVKRAGKADASEISPAGVRYLWTQLCKKLGVQRFTTHQLRHTAATAMLAAGEDPMAVAKFLGHKNLATLDVYAEVPESQRARTTATMDRFLKAG